MKKLTAILLVLTMILALSGCNSAKFVSAVDKYDAGNYAEAGEIFRKLGDYKDSAARLQECDYQVGIAAMAQQDYAKAAKVLGSLGDYRDSAEKAATAAVAATIKPVIGSWSADMDITEFVNTLFQAMELGEIANYITLPQIQLTWNFTVDENANWVLELDPQSAQAMLDGMRAPLAAGMTQYFEDSIRMTAEQYGLTLEDLLEAYKATTVEEAIQSISGASVSQTVDEYFDSVDLNEFLAESRTGGTLRMEGNVVTLSDGSGNDDTATLDESAGTLTLEIPENPMGLSCLVLCRN